MKLNAAIALSVLASVTSAAPLNTSTSAPQTLNKANNYFGGLPLVADCRKIVSDIAGGGTWTVQPYAQHQLVQFGTCAFGVRTGLEGAWHAIKVGNSDISDLINASINRFQWYGKVGAEGDMSCEKVTTGEQRVRWGIYHT
ncbi:hypothetical protein MferCBS31731_003473 [Microsporum ferrugineum]